MTEVSALVRENVSVRQCVRIYSPGYIATYVHNGMTPDSGLVASAVAIEGADAALTDAARTELKEIGKQIAMQVCAPVISCSFLAEISVTSPQKIFVSIIQ